MKIKSILIALMMGVGMYCGVTVGMDTPEAPATTPETTQPAQSAQPVANQPAITWSQWFNNIKESVIGKTAEEQSKVIGTATAVWNAIPESVKSVGGNIASYYVMNAMGGPVGIASTALSGAWTALGWVGGPTAIAKYAAWNAVQGGLQKAYNELKGSPEQNAVQIAGIKQESLQQMKTRLENQALYPTYWTQYDALNDPDEFPCDKANTLCVEGKAQLIKNLIDMVNALQDDKQEYNKQLDIKGEIENLREKFPAYKTDLRGYVNYIDAIMRSGINDEATMKACISEKGRAEAKAVTRKMAEGGTVRGAEEAFGGMSSRRRTTQPTAQTPMPSAQLQPIYVPATRTMTPTAPTLQFMSEELSPEESAQFRQVMERQTPTNRAAIIEYMRRLKEQNPDEVIRYVKAQLAKVPARVPQFEPVTTGTQTATKRSPSPARGRTGSRQVQGGRRP